MYGLSFVVFRRRRRVVLWALIIFTASFGLAQQVSWTGGTNTNMNSAGNWSTGALPDENSEVRIAEANGTGSIPSLTLQGNLNMSLRSFLFDNSAGRYGSNGLRIAATTGTSSSNQSTIYFNAAGTIITALNNAAVAFRSASLSNSSTANPSPSLTLNLNYDGVGVVNVDGASLVRVDEVSGGVPAATIVGTGGIEKVGEGVLRFQGGHTYAGGFTLNEGIFEYTASGSTSDGVLLSSPFGLGTARFNGGAVRSTTDNGRTIYNHVELDGNVAITTDVAGRTGDFTVSTSAGGTTTLISNSTLNIASTVTWNQTISGDDRSLTKTGGGTLVLNGANTYTGGTFIAEGTVRGDVGGGSLDVASGAHYELGIADRTIGRLSGGGQVALGTRTLATDSEEDSTFDGVIDGEGALVKAGSGTLTLTGENSYTGGTRVAEGSLAGDARSLQGDIENLSHVIFDQAADGTYSGNLTGSGTLTKTGGGKLTLAGQNAHSGVTYVQQGILQVNTVTMVGNLINDALVIWDQLTEGEYAGDISGAGVVHKTGGGTLRLTGANSYSGGTSVLEGTLVGDASSLQGNITNHGTIDFLQNDSGTYAGVMSGSGQLVKSGGGTLTLTGANSYAGGTTVASGTLVGDSISLQGSISNSATLVFNQTNHGTFNGMLEGSGTVQKLGAGTLTFVGLHNFNGSTHVDAGALRLNAHLGGTLHVAATAQLSGVGLVEGNATIAGVHAPGDEVGVQSFAGNLTYADGASIQLQFLSLAPLAFAGNDFAPSAAFDQILVGGDLVFAGATSVSLSFNAAGSSIDWFDPVWDADQSWAVFEVEGAITDFHQLTLASVTWLDANGHSLASLRDDAEFSLSIESGAVLLNYHAAAIPEPSTYAVLVGILVLAFASLRRRRSVAAA